MKKYLWLLPVLIVSSILLYYFLVYRNGSSVDSEDVVFKPQNYQQPQWVPTDSMGSTPWENPIYLAYSDDGLNFSNEKLFVDHAGVPNIIQTKDGKLIATFQYFSYTNEDLFDVIAYTVSDDYGDSWSTVKKITFSNGNTNIDGPKPVDPTLIELEDGSLRLYFTFEKPGDGFPQLYSAKSKSLEDVFQFEGKQLTTEEVVLDPAVIKFNNQYHHFTITQDRNSGGMTRNVHSVSSNGLDFKREKDISLPMGMLGDVIIDKNKLRFYGSGNGIQSATSKDGYSWEMDSGKRIDGADPGVVKMSNGKYLMVYTYMVQ